MTKKRKSKPQSVQPKLNNADNARIYINSMETDLRVIAQGVAALHLMAEGLHALRETDTSRAIRSVAESLEVGIDSAKEKWSEAHALLGSAAP